MERILTYFLISVFALVVAQCAYSYAVDAIPEADFGTGIVVSAIQNKQSFWSKSFPHVDAEIVIVPRNDLDKILSLKPSDQLPSGRIQGISGYQKLSSGGNFGGLLSPKQHERLVKKLSSVDYSTSVLEEYVTPSAGGISLEISTGRCDVGPRISRATVVSAISDALNHIRVNLVLNATEDSLEEGDLDQRHQINMVLVSPQDPKTNLDDVIGKRGYLVCFNRGEEPVFFDKPIVQRFSHGDVDGPLHTWVRIENAVAHYSPISGTIILSVYIFIEDETLPEGQPGKFFTFLSKSPNMLDGYLQAHALRGERCIISRKISSEQIVLTCPHLNDVDINIANATSYKNGLSYFNRKLGKVAAISLLTAMGGTLGTAGGIALLASPEGRGTDIVINRRAPNYLQREHNISNQDALNVALHSDPDNISSTWRYRGARSRARTAGRMATGLGAYVASVGTLGSLVSIASLIIGNAIGKTKVFFQNWRAHRVCKKLVQQVLKDAKQQYPKVHRILYLPEA